MTSSLPIIPISLPTPWQSPGAVAVYLIRQDPVTLVDTGLNDEPSRAALLAGLEGAGLTVRDIRRVLLTHAHHDHYGQAGWIQEESGAEVWMHPDEEGKAFSPDWWTAGRDQAVMQGGVPADVQEMMEQFWQAGRRLTSVLREWKPLADGQSFAFESGSVLRAMHLPGHALGHTAFWEPAGRVLIGGDHLLDGITPNPILEPVRPGHPAAVPHAPGRALTLQQFLDSLAKVDEMAIDRVLPAHGPVITDHRAVVRGYLERHQRRLAAVADRAKAGRTAYQLAREIFPWVQGVNIFLALSEVLAHLDLLVVRGQGRIEAVNSHVIYRTM